MYDSKKALSFIYTNWKGLTSNRNVIPEAVFYGATEFHKEPQWLMVAYDLDKEAKRIFAMTDIISWVK